MPSVSSELQVLNFGSHDEKIGANLFSRIRCQQVECRTKMAMRHDYENKFLEV